MTLAMTNDVAVAVVGAGPIGAAAAQHLAKESRAVALIGPDEPPSATAQRGIWGGWFDEGRMAHVIDLPLLSGLIGMRARRRFADLAASTGVDFFHFHPGISVLPQVDDPHAAGPGGEYFDVAAMQARSGDLNYPIEVLDGAALSERFPTMRFADGHLGVYQPEAMLINPRRLVEAEITAAMSRGAERIRAEVDAITRAGDSFALATSDGVIRAGQVIVAAGADINAGGLIPRPLAFDTYGATVTLAQVPAGTLAEMPTTMYLKMTAADPYAGIIAPPLRYADGDWYLKGAGDSLFRNPLNGRAEIERWVATGGDQADQEVFRRVLGELLPEASIGRMSTRPCLVTLNRTGLPYIGFVDDGLIVATEGDHGVTMGDEIGRLAARLALDGAWRDPLPGAPFAPVFA